MQYVGYRVFEPNFWSDLYISPGDLFEVLDCEEFHRSRRKVSREYYRYYGVRAVSLERLSGLMWCDKFIVRGDAICLWTPPGAPVKTDNSASPKPETEPLKAESIKAIELHSFTLG